MRPTQGVLRPAQLGGAGAHHRQSRAASKGPVEAGASAFHVHPSGEGYAQGRRNMKIPSWDEGISKEYADPGKERPRAEGYQLRPWSRDSITLEGRRLMNLNVALRK